MKTAETENIIKNTDLWIKLAETTYNDRDVIRTGWEEIQGNKLTELKVQLRYKFKNEKNK